MTIVALIPASGNATRMRGLPKFLLPNGTAHETLLEAHLRNLRPLVDEIRISVNPIFENILMSASLELYDSKIDNMRTLTMTETIINLTEKVHADKYLVVMPDTAFLGEEPYGKLLQETEDLSLSIWRVREEQKGKLGQVKINESNMVLDCIDKDANCDYKFAWGIQMFTPRYLDYLKKEQPHIGFGIVPAIKDGMSVKASIVNGTYWDCGTPQEYVDYLVKKRELK